MGIGEDLGGEPDPTPCFLFGHTDGPPGAEAPNLQGWSNSGSDRYNLGVVQRHLKKLNGFPLLDLNAALEGMDTEGEATGGLARPEGRGETLGNWGQTG